MQCHFLLKNSQCILLFSIIVSFVHNATHAQDTSLATAMESITITSRKISQSVLDTPYTVYSVNSKELSERHYRTTTDIFRDVPGALSQKTSSGQGSPFLRGLTGFHNLFLVDGIKLNNAVFRSGPNQYWNTVDPLSIKRMEIVMGPSSVLFGSDGIGGTVNALTKTPSLSSEEIQLSMFVQGAEAANVNIQGVTLEKAISHESAIRVSANRKDFGDMESAGGRLPNTGYDEVNFDLKLYQEFSQGWETTFAHFLTHQQDVPRTHKTIYSVPFHGTTVGNELERNLDQKRELTYFKIRNDGLASLSHFNTVFSYQQQDESRHRERTGDRIDDQGFSVNTLGFILDSGVQLDAYNLLFGVDYYRDNVNSYSSSNPIQGAIADDASYTTFAGYSEVRWSLSNELELTAGLRYSHIAAKANKVADPTTEQATSLDKSWEDLVGSFRAQYHLNSTSMIYAGISEGFRAPNLSDLTRLDSARSNEFEIPSVNLDSEKFVSYELGYRKRKESSSIDIAVYYTELNDQIILYPNGSITENGEVVMAKSNEGDGYIYGTELSFGQDILERLNARISLSYQYGKTKGIPVAGSALTEDYLSRLMPWSGHLSMRYTAESAKWWIESQIQSLAEADKLSARDQTDTQRIPPGGTPSFVVFHIRGGYELSKSISVNIALENLLDKNYRVHGSGQNEVGRNLVASVLWEF
ncbi:TonB-dependent receptor [Paraglaciecola agarilytica]|uniref:TonB-dependent receptor n=1 Tax=Paraglaciecola chathamensis TaxID=368405 RepID=UPI001C08F089|nr:TonB-dependent receptor [Paraglaciecola agarilytica]MBU3017387.1 TonB-dependent receptor [Paraglaciecola agarilytica]